MYLTESERIRDRETDSECCSFHRIRQSASRIWQEMVDAGLLQRSSRQQSDSAAVQLDPDFGFGVRSIRVVWSFGASSFLYTHQYLTPFYIAATVVS